MSRRWRSELTLDLRRNGCEALLRPGLAHRVAAAQASGDGEPEIAIASALAKLRQTLDRPLPRTATLTVPDEQVYYALIPATGSWSRRNEIAGRHFAEMLGRTDLVVQTGLAASGRCWLSAAVEAADHEAWHRACAEAGVALEHLYPALLEDLHRIAGGVPDDAVLAAVREEGVMLIRVVAGSIDELVWERCSLPDIEQRVSAFGRTRAHDVSCPTVFFHRPSVDSGAVRRMAQAHGWLDVRAASSSASRETPS